MQIKIGEIYEDCAYHPVLCTESDGDDVAGYSLFDGSHPRSCSIKHCGVVKLKPEHVAFKIKNRDMWLAAEGVFHGGENVHAYDKLLEEEYNWLLERGIIPSGN